MKDKISYLLIILSLTNFKIGFCNNSIKQGVEMGLFKKNVRSEDRYKNFSTSQSCIEVRLKDAKTGQPIDIIIGNEQFSKLLAEHRGISVSSLQIKSNQEAYLRFLNEEYIPYMVENEGKPIDIGLDLQYIKKHTPAIIAVRPITFEQLNVSSEQEFINKYFIFDIKKGSGILKGEYYEKYTRDPAFIKLLLNLGYDVVWGDYVPNLNIYIHPFIAHFEKKIRQD